MLDVEALRRRSSELSGDPRVAAAVERLRAGGAAAFPTETVFALAVDGLSQAAVERLYALKGRPAGKPMPLLVADVAMAERAAVVSSRARAVMRALWPGPLTLVLPAQEAVPPIVRSGGATVGVRCPAHPLALAIVGAFGGPLAAPSANRAGESPATTAGGVRRALSADDALLVDDEPPRPAGAASTVIALGDGGAPDRLLRAGPISLEQVAAAAGSI